MSISGCTDSARGVGVRGVGCSVIFRHEEKDLLGVVHGDDFVFVIKVRAVLGPEDEDQKDEVLLG